MAWFDGAALARGGFVQGLNLNDPTLAFSETTQTILPYLRGCTLAWIF